MNVRFFPFRGLMFSSFACSVLLTGWLLPNAVMAETPFQAPAEAAWFRQIVQLSGPVPEAAELRLAGSGVVTVYLNGQRLVRNHALTDTVAWNVGPLLRTGANCVAIASAATPQPRSISAWLQPADGLKANPANWKTTSATPPVGWQQTDFNDRDWKPAENASALAATEGEPIQLTWKPVVTAAHVDQGHFRFLDGDHVVLLGGTFFERAQEFGHLEAALTAAAGDLHVTFRNLGWSADTVFAESRGIFDSPQKGYERMIEHVRAEEPTVILVCYGQNEALSFGNDDQAVARFQKQLQVLQKDLATTGAQLVLISPHPFVKMPEPLPDATRWNSRLSEFRDAMQLVAAESDVPFVDLYANFIRDMETVSEWFSGNNPMPSDLAEHPELNAARNARWTSNGMHWEDEGYRRVAMVFASRLLHKPLTMPVIEILLDEQPVKTEFVRVRSVDWAAAANQLVQLEFQPDVLSPAPLLVQLNSTSNTVQRVFVQSPSTRDAAADSRTEVPSHRGSAAADVSRFVIADSADYQTLRTLIVRKNELYFHRWRPQNITYLFGFRKHEQGNNASEIAMFDPLIDDLEQQIHKAKTPSWHTLTVTSE